MHTSLKPKLRLQASKSQRRNELKHYQEVHHFRSTDTIKGVISCRSVELVVEAVVVRMSYATSLPSFWYVETGMNDVLDYSDKTVPLLVLQLFTLPVPTKRPFRLRVIIVTWSNRGLRIRSRTCCTFGPRK